MNLIMKKYYLLLIAIFVINIANAQTPNWLWAKSAGGTGNDGANLVAVDASGNAFVVGIFSSTTITFGSTILTNAGGYDIFLAKYDASGNVLWAKNAGGINDDEANSVAVDTLGNIYITGFFSSPTITFGSTTLTNVGDTNSSSGQDIFLAKYDAEGNLLWAKSAGGISYDRAISVAVDASGNAYLTGGYNSPTISFGSDTLINVSSSEDIFLAKYDVAGNVLWAKSAGGTNVDRAISVGVDALGNSSITGFFLSPTLTFGSTTLMNAGGTSSTPGQDIFLAKYDAAGNVLWAKSAGGTSDDIVSSIAVDALGSICITGYFSSTTINFGTDTLTNAGDYDIFLTKYDTVGNVLWTKSAGGTSIDMASSVRMDVLGNTYVTGVFEGSTLAFGSIVLDSAGIFLVKYDADGIALWAKRVSGSTCDLWISIALDATGNTYMSGSFSNNIPLTFGSTTLTNAGSCDIFLAKLSSVVGIKENSLNNISVYPNPIKNNLTIETNSIKEQRLEIINLIGQTVYTIYINKKATINTSAFANGVYILKLSSDKETAVRKFVKE